MPRASRYLLPGYTYHLTQRCHDRRFLLRFAKDRDAYREWLRAGVNRHGVAVYGYNITCNHVHVVAHVDDVEAVSRMMQLAAGAGGQQYNRRKGTSGAFWEDTYQCTVIENGRHLWNCLLYVELNMVRAGAVTHPAEWRWSGYAELTGQRQRFRILSLERLLESLGGGSLGGLRASLAASLAERLAGSREREPHWTESLAVGSRGFVSAMECQYGHRSRFILEQRGTTPDGETWAVRESPEAYSAV